MPSLDPEPVHRWFGLTYSNYLVLPRTIMQSMPQEWQSKMVALLEEANEACEAAGIELQSSYRVQPVNSRGRYVRETIPHYRHAPNLFAG